MVLKFRAVLGCFFGTLGAAHGYVVGPLSLVASTMRFPFLSEALIHNLNFLSKKLQVFWFGAVFGTLRGGTWGYPRSPKPSQKNGDPRRGGKTASYSIIAIFLLNNQDFGKPKEVIRNLMGKVLKPAG